MSLKGMIPFWGENRFTERGKGGAICSKRAAAWFFLVIRENKMVRVLRYSFQGIRAKLYALSVECRNSRRLWIHVEEVRQFIFHVGGTLGNKEGDRPVDEGPPVPCQIGVRTGKFRGYG